MSRFRPLRCPLSLIAWVFLAALPVHAQDQAADVVRTVRSLGQAEQPSAVKEILPLVAHGRVEVRLDAANALGQALFTVPRTGSTAPPPELATAMTALLARLRVEADPAVRGVVAETLGRLPHRSAAAMRDVEQELRVRLQDAHPAVVAGAAKGLEALIRNTIKIQPPEAATITQLRAAATLAADPSDADLAQVRRLAWLALVAAGPVDIATIERGFDDSDLQVRRRAVVALATAEAPDRERRSLLARALADKAFQVRYEAVRTYSRTLQAADCAPLLAALDDVDVLVSLAAVDALGEGCPAGPSPTARLLAMTSQLQNVQPAASSPGAASSVPWHRPAHAFVALARTAREDATKLLPVFAEHPDWQVRLYAARGAAALGAAARLERMASDTNDNVRHAAIEGLRTLRRHEADAIYVDALGRRDYQLVLLAAQALEGSPNRTTAAPALLNAFQRMTAEKRDTSRDPRVALLIRLRELGSAAQGAALRSCLTDWDPVVAAECTTTVRSLAATPTALSVPSSTPRIAAPSTPAVPPPPSYARVTMRSGGVMEVRLFTEDAPATTARFIHLARQGYYNGLSFWRVAPGFVLQGGSPGSNEYAGDGPFMRDEIGLRGNTRGTVGLSTRGRNTGDAQFFVNLLDNPRLDHDFTVFGEITSGIDVADRILEGDIIERIDIATR
jgi:cyclophilin family peptidyl-prolyl cis-trans isomerase/HEAT repeat protein